MTPEAQRIAIAAACPKRIRCHNYVDALGIWEWSRDGKYWNECLNNDPLQDLNAMHEAEKVLSDVQDDKYTSQRCTYTQHLWDIRDTLFVFANATAAQRAEAFLRTIGKWNDDL